MDVVTYTGTGTASGNTLSVTTKPNADFMWVKQRDTTNTASHVLSDVVRGNLKALRSNGADEENGGNIDPLQYDGIQNLGTKSPQMYRGTSGTFNGTNGNGKSYVGWVWQANGAGSTNTAGTITSTVSANTSAGFSVVTWAGTSGTSATVGHGLGVTPKFIIVKNRTNSYSWICWFSGVTNANQFLYLNQDSAVENITGYWGGTPTSTTFPVNATYQSINFSGNNYVAYCFAEVDGYSKFGTYTGNGSADGPFVYTGFRPKFVLIKRTDSLSNWSMRDSVRGNINANNFFIRANTGDEETVGESTFAIDFLSNGFKLRGTWQGQNANGGNLLYMAFAENPFKYSLAR
jgi:hypothetical protein